MGWRVPEHPNYVLVNAETGEEFPDEVFREEELVRDDTGEWLGGITQFYSGGPIYGYSNSQRTGPMSCNLVAARARVEGILFGIP